MIESTIVRAIQRKIPELWPRAYVRKNHGSAYATRGRPDLEVLIDGWFIGLEVKMPGRKPTASQGREARKIEEAQGFWFCVHSRDEAVEEIRGVVGDPPAR